MKSVFISDCEGPISKNDNAFEMTACFVPNGDRLFTVISRYDDVLAEVLRKPGYKAGDTLKLILPFLKAYDVTDSKMEEFSARNLILIPNIEETLKHVQSITDVFIVSTSYEHYIRAMCHALDFPCKNTYCTKLNLDKYHLSETEKVKLKKLAQEISQMPVFEIPPLARSLRDLRSEAQKTVRRLDEIFWKQISGMESGKIYSDIDPMGGKEKAEAIKDVVQKHGIDLTDVMYVGDSITDDEAFELVKENGGLTVSFNGNEYAVKSAEIAVLSENSVVTGLIADVFYRFGKDNALDFVKKWKREALEKSVADSKLLERLFQLCPDRLPKVKIITSENMETLAKESSAFRKKVRGEEIGRLG